MINLCLASYKHAPIYTNVKLITWTFLLRMYVPSSCSPNVKQDFFRVFLAALTATSPVLSSRTRWAVCWRHGTKSLPPLPKIFCLSRNAKIYAPHLFVTEHLLKSNKKSRVGIYSLTCCLTVSSYTWISIYMTLYMTMNAVPPLSTLKDARTSLKC